ncbi:MAG: hypothetical protein PF518_04560 [Spirochaetaceae bacterium]|jgi:hypothetical protein|nr:hypothetical protein [Spirochaetaceae bacterium]
MKRQNEEYWKKHIESWKISDLSMTEYSKNAGLVNSTFQRWVRKLKKNKIKPLKVNIPNDNSHPKEIILESSGIRLSLPADINVELLTVAIREIKKCS